MKLQIISSRPNQTTTSTPQGLPLQVNTKDSPPTDQKSTWKNIEVQNLADRMTRYCHTANLVDGNLIVIGGRQIKESLMIERTTLINFDLDKQSCQHVEVTGRDRKPLFAHSACYWKENKYVVFGGSDREATVYSEVGIITLSDSSKGMTAEWETVKTDGEIFRSYHTAHIYKDKMYVIGGFDQTKNAVNTVCYLDLVTMKWETPELTGAVPKYGVQSHSSVLYGNKIYVFYSMIRGGSWDNLSTIDLDIMTWETINSEGFPLFNKNTICSQEMDGQVYFFGGDEESSSPNELRCYNIKKNQWKEVEQAGKSIMRRTNATLIAYNDHLCLFGGFNKKRKALCYGFWIFPLEDNILASPTRVTGVAIEEQESEGVDQMMKKFFKEAPYSDIVFEVEGIEIPAHKWWLINRSKYFANMFSSGMIESKTNRIPVPDMKVSTFQAFLEFVYSDSVRLNEQMALELLKLADMYSVPDLKAKCEEFLTGILKFHNYLEIAKVAELVDSEDLKKAVVAYMAKEIKIIKARENFNEISDEYLRAIILKLTIKGS